MSPVRGDGRVERPELLGLPYGSLIVYVADERDCPGERVFTTFFMVETLELRLLLLEHLRKRNERPTLARTIWGPLPVGEF